MLGQVVFFFLGYGQNSDPIQGTGVITKVEDSENHIVSVKGSTAEYHDLLLQSMHYNATPTVGYWCYPEDLE